MKTTNFFEVSVTEGLEAVAADEIRHRFGDQVRMLSTGDQRPGVVAFAYGGSPRNLLQLRTALSLFWGLRFPIPRPRALLGHENQQVLLEHIQTVRQLTGRQAYKTIYLAAAGAETRVMKRLIEMLAEQTGLAVALEEGDLLIRVRRPLDGSQGWDVLVRMGSRPLSTRSWRVCDYRGALNAAVAHALALLTQPRPDDVFLNIACGSGSILIERAAIAPARLIIGCDISTDALDCARKNLATAGPGRIANTPTETAHRFCLAPWDARVLPLASGSISVICSDLPFGHYVGSHQENLQLYPRILDEAARVAAPGARVALLTHEIRLMAGLLEASLYWQVQQVLPLNLNGLHPRLYLLHRN